MTRFEEDSLLLAVALRKSKQARAKSDRSRAVSIVTNGKEVPDEKSNFVLLIQGPIPRSPELKQCSVLVLGRWGCAGGIISRRTYNRNGIPVNASSGKCRGGWNFEKSV